MTISKGSGLEGGEDDDEKEVVFNTFPLDDTGEIVHQIGLLQIWQRGYCDDEHSWADPPVFTDAFNDWLKAHNSTIRDYGAFGPPWVVFPDMDTAMLFEREVHQPGLQHFADYLNSDKAKALHENNRRVLEEWRSEK